MQDKKKGNRGSEDGCEESMEGADDLPPQRLSLCSTVSSPSSILNMNESSVDLELDLLTFRFHANTFNKFWTPMKELGWTYDSSRGTYQSPSLSPSVSLLETKAFASAGDVSQFLDASALPTLSGTNLLEPKPQTPLLLNPSELNLARHLRRALLTKLHEQLISNDDETETESVRSTNQGISAHKVKSSKQPPTRKRSSARLASLSSNSSSRASTTINEKGTDLYLHRHSRRRRKRPSSSSKQPFEASSFPWLDLGPQHMTLDKCINYTSNLFPSSDNNHDSTVESTLLAEWRFLLKTNHSLLFFGSGSKRALLTQLAGDELSQEGHVLLVDACQEDANMDEILDMLVQMFLKNQEPPLILARRATMQQDSEQDKSTSIRGLGQASPSSPLVDRAMAIGQALAEQSNLDQDDGLPIFLVIHSLDTSEFANAHVQEALEILVLYSRTSPNSLTTVRLVASVDSIDAPQQLRSRDYPTGRLGGGGWSWMYQVGVPITSSSLPWGRPYTEELRRLDDPDDVTMSKRGGKSSGPVQETLQQIRASRVVDVLRHLAPRHAEVVQILAQLQLDHIDRYPETNTNHNNKRRKSQTTTFNRVSYQVFCTECQRACAVPRESDLRRYLRELGDHGLVISTVDQDQTEFVHIPYDAAKLKEMVEAISASKRKANQQP